MIPPPPPPLKRKGGVNFLEHSFSTPKSDLKFPETLSHTFPHNLQTISTVSGFGFCGLQGHEINHVHGSLYVSDIGPGYDV